MGVFTEYVNAYGDLSNAYDATGTPNLGAYITSDSELLNTYQGDFNNKNWEAYVWTGGNPNWNPSQGDSDLEKAWQEYAKTHPIVQGKPPSKAEWGIDHYNKYGKDNGRQIPFQGLGSTILWNSDQWATTHWENYGKREGRTLPLSYPMDKETWGATHWDSKGKREERILPGGGQFTISPQGTISINKDAIGEDFHNKFENFASRYNSSDGTNFQDIANSLNNLGATESRLLSDSGVVNSLVNAYYGKVPKWDPDSNAAYQPPMGKFEPSYYVTTEQGKKVFNEWQKALQGSIDIGGTLYEDVSLVGKYNQDTFLQYNYAVVYGKTERGNAVTKAEQAEDFAEVPMTDAQYQMYRDQVMGLGTFTTLKEWEEAQDPEFLKQWIASLSPEDAQDRADGYLTIPSVTQIPEILRPKAKMSKGDTVLEGKLSTVLGPKEQEAANKFRSLTTDTFKETLKEYKKQRLKEQQYDFYSGLPGFNEIINVNQELTNSLLGDTGVGGILSLGGQDMEKTEDSLENQFSAITGIPSKSNSVYNWQKWFDETLKKRYEEGASFTDWEDASKQHTIDKEFAEDYIKRYLNPRFNTSRSMSEFMSYMDVTQGEENIFQTQSALSSLKTMADLRAKKWLEEIKNSGTSGFDFEFYFNPSGGDVGAEKHALQAEKVNQDWENAKTNGEQIVPGTNPPRTWNQLAYYHGYDIKDKSQFAKLHYQVYGVHQGFDPARDKLAMSTAQSFIDNDILPAIANEKVNLNNVSFLNFVTPREYADKMLQGIDPTKNKPEWEKLLESMGLSGKDMGIEEVKTYIEEAFQTGEATKIREAIKYLNEKKESVTQEKLGVDYIQRTEDTAPTENPTETKLYSIFKSAGFAGTEDDFYKEFMPDVNREDMELLTQAGKGFEESSVFSKLSSSDPFESFGAIEGLFGDEETSSTSENEKSSSTEKESYFSLYNDEDDEDTTTAKSNAGQSFLGSFTSAFKNFRPKY